MSTQVTLPSGKAILCAGYFQDQGLKFNAEKFDMSIEYPDDAPCPYCQQIGFRKLTKEQAEIVAHSFFVWGSLRAHDYGAAPELQVNELQEQTITGFNGLESDLTLLSLKLNLRVFRYGPRLWMIGQVEPLKALHHPDTRLMIIERIIAEYRIVHLDLDTSFYRVRKTPEHESDPKEYDAPPTELCGKVVSIRDSDLSCTHHRIYRFAYMSAV